ARPRADRRSPPPAPGSCERTGTRRRRRERGRGCTRTRHRGSRPGSTRRRARTLPPGSDIQTCRVERRTARSRRAARRTARRSATPRTADRPPATNRFEARSSKSFALAYASVARTVHGRRPGSRGSATPATGPARLRRPRAKNRPCGLVTLALVDQGDQRLVRAHAAQVLAERVDDTLGAPRRAAGGVRGHDRARMGPEAMVGRKRLRIGHVEPGAADRLFIERFEQIVAVDDRAARDVDQVAGLLHLAEEIAREEMVRR